MGNKKWTRVLALVMALVCTLTVVAAVEFDALDHNQDGKVTVWDLQQWLGDDTNYNAALKQVLGGHGDELNPVDEEGKVYEIYTAFGLQNMASLVERDSKNGEGMTFKLMKDVDLMGANWDPIKVFKGTFDGNGHAIKNLKVTGFDSGSYTNYSNQGFFGKIAQNGVVKNLNLVNITLDASKMPANRINRIGLLAGSSTGLVQDCTTIGKVIDNRTELEKTAYIGTLLGAIETTSQYEIPGVVFTENFVPLRAEDEEALREALQEALTVKSAQFGITNTKKDAEDLQTVKNTLKTAIGTEGQPVVSKLAMDYAQTTSGKRITRIVASIGTGTIGSKPDVKQHFWQDISGSVTMQDPVLAQRRQAVVDYMYQMCTVEWTTGNNMTSYFYRAGSTNNVLLKCVESNKTTKAGQGISTDNGNATIETREYKVGQSYRGIPYMHASSSLERFNSWLENGKLKATLPTSAYYCSYEGLRLALNKELTRLADTNETVSYEIWTRDDNANPVEKITNAFDVTGFARGDQALETTNDTMQKADISGYARYIGNDCSSAIMQAWRKVVSSDVANGGTVISGVKQMTPTSDYQSTYGVMPVDNLVPTSADADAYYTSLGDNAQSMFVAAYAKASRGDALICDDHSRMIAYDPIVIMNANGVVDLDKSYFITHEQGRGSYEAGFVSQELADKYSWISAKGWKSDCTVNCLYTFRQLTEYSGMTTGTWGIGTAGHYMPVTLPVFHDVNSKAANTNEVTNSYIKWENGAIKSNFYILSTQVGDEAEVFTGVTQHQTTATDSSYVGHGYRDARVEVTMDELIAAHGADVAGKSVTVKLSNGYTGTVTVPAA